jgi:hypothetical protein
MGNKTTAATEPARAYKLYLNRTMLANPYVSGPSTHLISLPPLALGVGVEVPVEVEFPFVVPVPVVLLASTWSTINFAA